MIALGSDAGGAPLKKEVIKYLESRGLEYKDFGTDEAGKDYPIYGVAAAEAVASGECDRGIVVCGTGIGISIAANKVPGIRCALCSDSFSAWLTRQHNDSNMLAMGGRIIGVELALEIVKTWLDTPFSGVDRHARRINEITEVEKRYNK